MRHRIVITLAAAALLASAVPAAGDEFRPENDEFGSSMRCRKRSEQKEVSSSVSSETP